ncbi:hypothetical protein CYLTODRAFT_145990 [Cylindrobasidium torrendii FP15055 ss-10]|uniref:Uncharacterized protein n=1 Tax=Cylindrobasidium torrendii FP15055 ss-10 TaxID=1314674 RepID=A0A0D7AXZ6_9AGAR|nr:hypothetical protein CYLTODRAFT_145990 [Cylindrobasidium torrendii FP15055 ss-10]
MSDAFPVKSTAVSSQEIPEIITYRFENNTVYVKPLTDYEAAKALAIREFPCLAGQDIFFSLNTTTDDDKETHETRIAPEAWGAALRTLRTATSVVDVKVVELPTYRAEEKSVQRFRGSQAKRSGPGRRLSIGRVVKRLLCMN